MWRRSLWLFVLGLCFGGLFTGVVLGALAEIASPVPARARAVLAVVLVVSVAVIQLSGRADRLPQNRRLVPQDIGLDSPDSGAFQFGAEMGTGLRTFSPSAAPFLLGGLILLVGSLLAGSLAGLGFALGRAITPLGRRYSGDEDRWERRLISSHSVLGSLSVLTLAGIALVSGAG